MSRDQKVPTRAVPIALLATGLVAIFHATSAADMPDSGQVSRLLLEMKTKAFQLKEDAAALESCARSGANWESHNVVVSQMKKHVNEAGWELMKLEEARKSAAPWQRTAIDEIQPSLVELSVLNRLAIKYIDDDPERLFTKQYKDFLETNVDAFSSLAAMMGDFVDYGNTRTGESGG